MKKIEEENNGYVVSLNVHGSAEKKGVGRGEGRLYSSLNRRILDRYLKTT
jgi:hypothetical protein